MGSGWPPKRPHNKPPTSRAALEAALAAHDRILAVSTEIRARHGLPPVADNDVVRAWRTALAAKASPAKSKPAADPQSPEQRLEAIAKGRERRRREEAEADAELRQLVCSKAIPARRIADRLGVTRQRVYQLA